MTKQKQELFFDEIVIGAGLTGLSFGIGMANANSSVCIFEKHYKAGGYATNFSRKRKYFFDCSLHKITGIGPEGNLRNALERLGVWSQINFKSYTDLSTIIIGQKKYYLPAEFTKLKKSLYSYFTEDSNGLDHFFHDLDTHGYQNYMFARMALGEYKLDKDLLPGSRQISKLTAAEYFKEIFNNQDLIILFSSIAINLGVVAEEADALYFLHFAYTFFKTGTGYVENTSQSLSDKLADIFREKGGQLFLNEPVLKIHATKKGIRCIETKKTLAYTKNLTVTCSPHNIVNTMVADVLSEEFKKKLNQLEFGLGAFSVYLAFDVPPEKLGFERSEYILASTKTNGDSSEDIYHNWPLSVTNYHLLDPSNGYVIQLIVLDTEKLWFKLSKEDYKNEKNRVQELIIERTCKVFPNIKKHIVYQESSTPRTNYRYTLSPHGSAFGYKPLPGRNVRFLQKEPIPGLNFIGTWINGAGYEPAICFGFTQSEIRKASLQVKEKILV